MSVKKKTELAAAAGIDLNLVKAIAHPYRYAALWHLNQRVASPNELAAEMDVNLSELSYHVRELKRLGCIELVRTAPRRGAKEHFYRARKRAFFSDQEWVRLPPSIRESIVAMHINETGRHIGRAIEAGTFEAREDRHHTYTPMVVDEQGWTEAMEALMEMLEKLMEIEAASTARLVESKQEGIPMAVSMIGFQTAPKES